MSDTEKFQALKQKLVQEHEKNDGDEACRKYGDGLVDDTNQSICH